MDCPGHDPMEVSGSLSSHLEADHLGSCLVDTKKREVSLLQLPAEVLSHMLLYLPSSALIACLHVDPILWALIRDEHFLDRYTRRVLALSNSRDKDIRFRNLPQTRSPLLEIWFLSFDAHSSVQNGACFMSRRNSLFFGLDCFKHSLFTWLAQATTAGTQVVKHVSNSGYTKLFSKCVNDLPEFVLEPLTKLMFAFPELIEATVWATHLSLHKGKPSALNHAWHDGIQETVNHKLDCKYSLEIICGQTVDSASCLSAVIMSFSPDLLIVWTGDVTHFPGCRFEKTISLEFMSPSSTLSAIIKSCLNIKELVCKHSVLDNHKNSQWKRDVVYPGLCHHLCQNSRKDLISQIKNVANETLNKQVTIPEIPRINTYLTCCCPNCELCSLPPTTNQHIKFDSSNNNNLKLNCTSLYKCAHAQIRQHYNKTHDLTKTEINYDNIKDEQNKSCTHYRNDLNAGNESNTLNAPQRRLQERTSENSLSLVVQKHNLIEQVETFFRNEILRYICDPESHQMLCPSCSKVWFPCHETLTRCIAQIVSRDFIPVELWPYHVLCEAVLITA